jgi:colanic acid/amylovoran biosynthesis protein
MNSTPRICMLGSSFGTNNFGVSVLTLGTVQCLVHTFPQAEISILDYGRESTVWTLKFRDRNVRLPLVNIRFSKKPWQSNHIVCLIFLALVARLTPFARMRKSMLVRNSVLQHLGRMDFITAISGGDSFSDIYGMQRFIYVALPQILVLLLNKRLILLPQTLGPFRARTTRAISRFILRRADRIYSRDKQGLAVAEELIGSRRLHGKLRFTHDVGFVVQPDPPSDQKILEKIKSFKRSGPLVGLNVSGLLFMGGYSRKNMFGLKTDYRQLTYAMIDWFRTLDEGTLLLVPHTLGKDGTESDLQVCRGLYEQFQPVLKERIQFFGEGLNERQTKFVIGQCDFFSGARMHACIAAISQCVTSVPVAYSDKFIGVMETVGVGLQVADPRNMTEQEILALISAAFENRSVIRDRLRRTMVDVIDSTLQLFNDLDLSAPVIANPAQNSVDREETPSVAV